MITAVPVETMTLSRDDRLQNSNLALRVLGEQLGQDAIYKRLFNPSDTAFQAVKPTSWKYLAEMGLVTAHETLTSIDYELTGRGWYAAMALTGILETPTFQQRFGALSAALKKYVKGRHADGITTVRTLANDTQLPEDWVYNVIASNIWQLHHQRVGPRLDGGLNDDTVWIPINFNMSW